jgi:hypothetical protein
MTCREKTELERGGRLEGRPAAHTGQHVPHRGAHGGGWPVSQSGFLPSNLLSSSQLACREEARDGFFDLITTTPSSFQFQLQED